jgi:hypothetical protein
MHDNPRLSVTRDSFFTGPSGTSLQWGEASPLTTHQHDFECGCTEHVQQRPAGVPTSVRQDARVSWDDCVIALEPEVAEPWVTFRRANDTEDWIRRRMLGTTEADEDHAYFIFNKHQNGAKIEVSIPGFGLVDCLLVDLFLGNRIDMRRLLNGHSPSRLVDLSKIAPDQVWIHASSWGKESMRTLDGPEAVTIREIFGLAQACWQQARPHLLMQDAPIDAVRHALGSNEGLLTAALNLRRLLSQFAFAIKNTRLFHLAREINTELELSRRA